MKNNFKEFPERLAKLMRDRGVSQSQLAKATGIAQQGISFYLNGKVVPKLEIIIKLSEYFHVTPYKLTGVKSLENIKKDANAVGELSAEEKAVIEAYNSLSEDDWRRKAVDEILLKTDKEVEKKKGE